MQSSSIAKKVIVPVEGQRNVLITSALPYVNNVPHLGTIIGCVLSADVFARYCRLRGYNTLYVCGTDEYGTATETKAIDEGCSPEEICEKYYKLHKDVYDWFNISFDHFGRTSTQQQTKIAQDIFMQIHNNGYTTTRDVEQLYCSNCSRFLADRFVEGGCPFCGFEDARGDQCDACGRLVNAVDLKSPRCKLCSKSPTLRTSKHLFIDLPKLQRKVEHYLHTQWEGGQFVWSNNAISITNGWLNEGLRERCITRDLKWGTPVPLKEFSDKVFYVWFDAPIGYISITASLLPNHWKQWWLNRSNVQYYNFVGKDNVIFHSIIFPASLLATGQPYTLVNCISATDYLTYEGAKFSKSRGVGVFGTDVQTTNIPADVWRFYLIHSRPESQDASFTWFDFAQKVNAELLNDFGNLINRSLAFISKNFQGVIGEICPSDLEQLSKGVTEELVNYVQNMESLKLRDGLKGVLAISRMCNQYMQNEAPWKLVKGSAEDRKKAHSVVSLIANVIALMEPMLQPFMPHTCDAIQAQLNSKSLTIPQSFQVNLKVGHKIGQIKPLFEKIEADVIEKYRAKFAGPEIKKQNGSGNSGSGPMRNNDLGKSNKGNVRKQIGNEKCKLISIGELKNTAITKDHLNMGIVEIENLKAELSRTESNLLGRCREKLEEENRHYRTLINEHIKEYCRITNRQPPEHSLNEDEWKK